jgi:malonyl CoA-acyl carrier protein transacylase
MKTYVFPGQGSQAKGMGGTLFDEFKELTDQADDVLGYSIKQLCLEDPRQELSKTQFTQPALYVVNALSYFKRIATTGKKPDFLAGHSLGEFNALLAAGCFDFETGLRLVQKRGQLMSQASGGGMAAILNASKEEIEGILRKHALDGIDLANFNTPSQIVISGPAEEISQAQRLFQTGKIRYHPLNTSGAFHSRLMQSAQREFRSYLDTCKFADLERPVIANVKARPYQKGNIIEDLSSQIASPVRWTESIQYLLALGLHRGDTMEFDEVGHGDVLTKLCQTIRRQTSDASLAAHLTELRQDGFVAAPAKVTAQDKAQQWNSAHPVGTKVKSFIMEHTDLETRSEAVVLFGHRAAVYMKGFNGYFDLDEVRPL